MLEPSTYLIMALIGVLTGFIDSIAGGGGLIMMPALLMTGITPIQALGTNKLQSMFGTSIATANYYRKGLFDIRPSLGKVALVFVGASAGVLAVQQLKPGMLGLIIPVLLMASAAYVLLSPRMTDEDAHVRLSARAYGPVGGAIGFYDGFFGPGTGSFFSTSLVALRGMGLTRATALTKLLNLTSNVASVLFFAIGGKIVWTLGFAIAGGAMIGNYLGSHTAMKFGAKVIRPLLVTLSLGLTAKLLWQYFSA
ncbi:TSUP family transporter [Sphingomonas jaspsi]|uniref:TSUP family transporter n=1 Tax=Sphingomonas jaspsi TaxID=392409 RepID=UPI00068444C8|nr:TSUP family transporter [Sphingomonas jaspsi]